MYRYLYRYRYDSQNLKFTGTATKEGRLSGKKSLFSTSTSIRNVPHSVACNQTNQYWHLITENHIGCVLVGDHPGVLEDVDDVAHERDLHVLEIVLVQVEQHAHFYPKRNFLFGDSKQVVGPYHTVFLIKLNEKIVPVPVLFSANEMKFIKAKIPSTGKLCLQYKVTKTR